MAEILRWREYWDGGNIEMAEILRWQEYWDGGNTELAESCTNESNEVQNYINWHWKKVEKTDLYVLAEAETDESKQMGRSYKL